MYKNRYSVITYQVHTLLSSGTSLYQIEFSNIAYTKVDDLNFVRGLTYLVGLPTRVAVLHLMHRLHPKGVE